MVISVRSGTVDHHKRPHEKLQYNTPVARLISILFLLVFSTLLPLAPPAVPAPCPNLRILTLEAGSVQHSLIPYVDILEDPTGRLTIHDVASQPLQERFRALTEYSTNLGYSHANIWLRFTLDGLEPATLSEQQDRWILHNGWRFFSRFSLFIPQSAKTNAGIIDWKEIDAGAEAYWNRYGKSGIPMEISLPSMPGPVTLYLCTRTWGITLLDLSVTTQRYIEESRIRNLTLQAVFMFGIFLILLFNLFLFLSMRAWLHAWYLFYVLFFALCVFRANGPPIPWLHGISPEMDHRLILVTGGLALVSFIQMNRIGSRLAQFSPWIDRMLAAASWFLLPAVICSLFMAFAVVECVLIILGFISVLILFSAWSRQIVLGRKAGWRALVGFAPLMTCSSVYFLSYLGMIPVTTTTALKMLQAGMAIEAILLGLSTFYGHTIIREKNKIAENRLQVLFNTVSDWVFAHDEGGRFLSVNPAIVRGLGLPEDRILATHIYDYLPGPYRQLFFEDYLPAVMKNGHRSGMMVMNRQDGGREYLEYRVVYGKEDRGPGVISGIGHIVTGKILADKDIRHLQKQLLQSQKMEAIGTLTSGITHDFNNLLQSIIAPLAIIRKQGYYCPSQERFLTIMEKASERGTALIRQLMAFGRKLNGEFKPTDLIALTHETVGILRETVSKLITIQFHSNCEKCMINGDPGQIQQVLMNLGVNARDAMPDGGLLRFEVLSPEADQEPAYPEKQLGEYAVVRVSDTGTGMTPEILAKIFEPFFTTKTKGRGTGLGLAMVYTIVKDHGGQITCESSPGKGTCFTLQFNRLPEENADEPNWEETDIQPLSRHEHVVLFADDEDYIREVLREVLLMAGSVVLEAADGLEAMEIFKAHRQKIDLVILDLNMPVMGGKECLREIREMGSTVNILISTGSSDMMDDIDPAQLQSVWVITKPYTPAELMKRIKTLPQDCDSTVI
ncbi:MAG: ATP-binding protein [Pseudomonadota bacterium]